MRQTKWIFPLLVSLLLTACGGSGSDRVAEENAEAKHLLQGIWVDDESEEPVFRAQGDTIFYPDSTSQPAYFKIVGDSLVLGASTSSYAVIKQSAHIFWFRNQNGDVIRLRKSEDPEDKVEFVHDESPKVLTYTEVVKHDSTVFYNGERYHWYIAINPTRYQVHVPSYNDDGIVVDNVYFDNIMHISVFRGAAKVYSKDHRKQMYEGKIPAQFLQQSILGSMEFVKADAEGLHFSATVCQPDGASCYKVDNIVGYKGELSTRLLEY